jgi:hypothetical protein
MARGGQSRRFRDDQVMPGSPPAPDIPATIRHVGFGPETGISRFVDDLVGDSWEN